MAARGISSTVLCNRGKGLAEPHYLALGCRSNNLALGHQSNNLALGRCSNILALGVTL